MKKLWGLGLLLLLPSIVFGAGFAKQSLFLSKSPVTEGDSVKIFAVLANESSAAFSGSIVFSDGDTKIASTPATIAAGGAQTVSVAWKPAAGSHVVTAALTGSDGTVVEKESETFNIAEKPKPPPPQTTGGQTNFFSSSSVDATTIDSSKDLQIQIKGYAPWAGIITDPLFALGDTFRNSAANFLDGQLANTKGKIAGAPTPSFSSTTLSDPSFTSSPQGVWGILWTVYFYILTVLRFLVGNVAVFYPLLVLIFFFILWRIYRRMRRPSY